MTSNLNKSLVLLVTAAELAACAPKLVKPVLIFSPESTAPSSVAQLVSPAPSLSYQVPPEPSAPPVLTDEQIEAIKRQASPLAESQRVLSDIPKEPYAGAEPQKLEPQAQAQVPKRAQTPAPSIPLTAAPPGYKPIVVKLGPNYWTETATLDVLFGVKNIPSLVKKTADNLKLVPYKPLSEGYEVEVAVNYGAKDGVQNVKVKARKIKVNGKERMQTLAEAVAEYAVGKVNEHSIKNGAPLDVYSRMPYSEAEKRGFLGKIKSYRERGRWRNYDSSVQVDGSTSVLVRVIDGIKGDIARNSNFTIDKHLVEDTQTTALNSRGYAGAIVLLPAVASSVDPGELRTAESPYQVGPSQQSPNQQSPAPADGKQSPLVPGALVARANGLNGSYQSPASSMSAANGNGMINLVRLSGIGNSSSDPLDKRVASLMPPVNERQILREAAVQLLQHYGKI